MVSKEERENELRCFLSHFTSNGNNITQAPILLLSTISHLISVKLNNINYTLWRYQITSIFESYSLMDLVDRSTQPPEMFLHDANGNLTSAENNLYKPWKVRDQAIKTLINATLSSSALSLVMKQITARDVWKTLERRYTSLSRTHVLSLKAELDRVRKNNYTMTIYLDRVKEIRDKLSFVGVEIDDEELLHVVLKGLPPEYDAFCSAMRTRDKSLSCEDLHVLLTSEEESKKNAKSIAHELQHMAMAATRFKGPPTTNTPLPLFSGFWNRGRGGHSPNYRGRGRGGSQSSRGGYTNQYNPQHGFPQAASSFSPLGSSQS
jgi:hypothetical protein